jgi:CheY-like chemotaxis protein
MGTTRVLVVDDDPMNLSVLVRVLGRVGIETVTAEDGQEALALLKAKPEAFDVMLLDLVMPRMDGLQLLKRVKASSRLRHIPVILQAASTGPEEISKGLQAGAYYYLIKPLTQKVLLAVVRSAAEVCARHRALSLQAESQDSPMAMLQEGRFTFQTLHECHELSNLLAKLCPHPGQAVTGLSELLINALEHGNLGITYDDKTALLLDHRWKAEVQARQLLPENLAKCVEVIAQRLPGKVRFEIRDQGPGFDWQSFLTPSPGRLMDNHGRGIFMAKMDSFDTLEYLGNGNQVVAEVYAT